MSQKATPARSALGESLYQGLEALPLSRRLSAQQLEVIYALAYAHVSQQQYAQALPVFAFLAHYGPTRQHYLAGLALCLQMSERYEEAVRIYSLIITLFPDAAVAALRIAECELAQGQLAQARQTLLGAAAMADEAEAGSALGVQARALHDLLSNEDARVSEHAC
jgi:type III secretion system low calcium response chaperone LcrH/SycD